MAVALDKVRIQNALVSRAKAGVFYALVINAATGLMSAGAAVQPLSAFANEIRGTYATAKINHLRDTDDRSGWTWELRLEFGVHAALESFERSITQTPIKIPRDTGNGFDRQVTLHLRNAVYQHAPEQNPTQGSRVVYTFEATLSPL